MPVHFNPPRFHEMFKFLLILPYLYVMRHDLTGFTYW
nr:MAG TPA: hypothetical protein [Caudoviricetes sp.]